MLMMHSIADHPRVRHREQSNDGLGHWVGEGAGKGAGQWGSLQPRPLQEQEQGEVCRQPREDHD
jgi:hypothetical protein